MATDPPPPSDSDPRTPRAKTIAPPVEGDFLAALGERPDDDATRLVYADWLEERGQHLKAEFLRLQCKLASVKATSAEALAIEERVRALSPASDAWWRAVTGRAAIERCDVRFALSCPKTWSALKATDDPGSRYCGTCDRRVYFCATLVDVMAHGRAGECVAFDMSLLRGEALEAYETAAGAKDQILMGEIDPGG